jgi:hypothetical protein
MSGHAIRTIVVAIATGAIFALGASAAAARTQIPVYDGPPHAGKNPLATPGQILWTGDTTGMFAGRGTPGRSPKGRVHWSKWTATEGRGTGANWLNNCIPFCAAGKWTPFNVNLTVYRPRTLLGHKVFTRIKVAYTGNVPKGFKRTGVFTLAVMNKVYLWNFPV